jgi:hypothetical protein
MRCLTPRAPQCFSLRCVLPDCGGFSVIAKISVRVLKGMLQAVNVSMVGFDDLNALGGKLLSIWLAQIASYGTDTEPPLLGWE